MVKFKALATALVCSIVSTTIPVLAQNQVPSGWIEVAQTQLGDRIFVSRAVRRNTIGRNRSVFFRVTTLFGKNDVDGTVRTSATYVSNCLTNTLQISSFAGYDSNSQLTKQINGDSGQQPVQQGSVGEILYLYGCSHLQK